MKKAINVILGLCALVLLYLCYESIMEPIHFNEERDVREAAVKARLLQIKTAEDLYRQQHEGAKEQHAAERQGPLRHLPGQVAHAEHPSQYAHKNHLAPL